MMKINQAMPISKTINKNKKALLQILFTKF